MKRLGWSVRAVSLLFAASSVVACGSSDGSNEPVWTSATSQSLACQGEGIHPEGCPIGKPPAPPIEPVLDPCPTGFTCGVTATTLAAPIANCGAPELVTQTATSGGAPVAQSLVSTCNLEAAAGIAAWASADPTFDASETTRVPGLAVAPNGESYLTYVMPAIPTAFPTSTTGSTFQATNETLVDGATVALPCTQFQRITPAAHGYISYEAAYCVDTPAVEAWVPTNVVFSSKSSGGYSTSIGLGFPDAPPGYIYVFAGATYDVIGGMCTKGCSEG